KNSEVSCSSGRTYSFLNAMAMLPYFNVDIHKGVFSRVRPRIFSAPDNHLFRNCERIFHTAQCYSNIAHAGDCLGPCSSQKE
ncbi:MAG: hypothetical protein Q8R64_16160, partial [Sulfurimicrobium sp.]|nr:hypothetical protein [Sulfurimicrobium sp.]